MFGSNKCVAKPHRIGPGGCQDFWLTTGCHPPFRLRLVAPFDLALNLIGFKAEPMQGERSNSVPFSKQPQEDVLISALLTAQPNNLLVCKGQCHLRAGRAFANSRIVPIQKRLPMFAEGQVCYIP